VLLYHAVVVKTSYIRTLTFSYYVPVIDLIERLVALDFAYKEYEMKRLYLRGRLYLLFTLIIVSASTFVGCDLMFGSEDSHSSSEDSHSSRPGDIPIPDSSSYQFPNITTAVEKSRVLQENLTNFKPYLTEEPTADPIDTVPGDYTFVPQHVTLIDNGEIVEPIYILYIDSSARIKGIRYDNPLKASPVYLAKKVRHRKVFQHQMSYPSTYSETHIVTSGTETTHAKAFEETSGWGTSATVGATNGFVSAEVTAEYSEEVSQTFEESISLSTYETKEQTFSTAPDEGENLLYAVWNRELVFQYIGADGSPWQALGYDFEKPIQFTNQTGKDMVTINDRFYGE